MEDFVRGCDGEADCVLVGHTHEQAYLSWKGKALVNPGSLGCSKLYAVYSFCLAEIEAGSASFCFKNVPYDNSQLGDDYLRRRVPAAERILKSIYGIEI